MLDSTPPRRALTRAEFSDAFPVTSNADLISSFGVSERTIIRWAREAGLAKAPSYVSTSRADAKRKPIERPGHQRCIGCGELKPLDDFHRANKGRSRMTRCKPCYSQRTNDWRAANPDADRAISRRSALKRTYGITVEEWDERYAEQGGRCAICGRPDTGRASRRLSVDHDHVTGKVRGLLCGSCNNGLGRFRDDRALLLAAAAYLTASATGGEHAQEPADADGGHS